MSTAATRQCHRLSIETPDAIGRENRTTLLESRSFERGCDGRDRGRKTRAEDQSDAVRGADHGRRAGVRERSCGRLREIAGELPAERVQAGLAAQRPRVDSIAGGGRALLRRTLRRRHRTEREADSRALDGSLMLVTALNPHIGY